jgi:predicted enzyme involved in methoxymalonyl-ACP biosynthesis
MSCRVLKRDMELAMFDALLARARLEGSTEVVSKYLPTKKNGMVADLYSHLGFENIKTLEDGETHWRFSIPSEAALLNSHIKVNHGQ